MPVELHEEKHMRNRGHESGFDRRAVVVSATKAMPLLMMPTSWAEAAAKMSQSVVQYQAMPKNGENCAKCKQFAAPNACKLVDGAISPNGWCRLWVAKAA
jgi:hypothetical protein